MRVEVGNTAFIAFLPLPNSHTKLAPVNIPALSQRGGNAANLETPAATPGRNVFSC